MIETFHDHVAYQIDITETLGMHPKTVSRALRRGGAPCAISTCKETISPTNLTTFWLCEQTVILWKCGGEGDGV